MPDFRNAFPGFPGGLQECWIRKMRGMIMEYQEGNALIDGIKIHYYRSSGKKPPLVLLHGATDDGLCWGQTARELAERYDVIMPDAQGHGLSDRLGPDFSFASHTKQAAGLIKELELQKPIIMGHSMGAGTTCNVAMEYPMLPKAIILEDPAWGIFPPTPENAETVNKNHEAIRAYQTEVAKLPPEDIKARCRQDNPTWPEEDVIAWAHSRKLWDQALFDKIAVNSRPYEEIVTRIECPTLLIIAEKGIVSRETAENAAKLWKSKAPFQWAYINGAGHSIRREQYAAFKSTLYDWLDTLK
jgi:pimeloyl-ACP methyl ester carboxylesterase